MFVLVGHQRQFVDLECTDIPEVVLLGCGVSGNGDLPRRLGSVSELLADAHRLRVIEMQG
jgi:hypothetical protein